MPTIRIQEFAGESPRVEARGAKAQVNENLMATSNDFRPMKGSVSSGAAANPTKSLYRMQSTSAWITDGGDKSFVRGQINDDSTERTYVSDNTGATMPYVFTNDTNTPSYLLGVPAPAKPEVSLLSTTKFKQADAEKWRDEVLVPKLAELVRASCWDDQYEGRFTLRTLADFEGSGSSQTDAARAGITYTDPRQTAAGGFYQVFPSRLYENGQVVSQRGLYEPWNFFFRIPAPVVTPEGMGNPRIDAILRPALPEETVDHGYTHVYLAPIACIPLWGYFAADELRTTDIGSAYLSLGGDHQLKPGLDSLLVSEIKYPTGDSRPLFTDAQRAKIKTALSEYLAPPPATDARRIAISDGVQRMAAAGYKMITTAKPLRAVFTTEAAFNTAIAEWNRVQADAVDIYMNAKTEVEAIGHAIEADYINRKETIEDYLTDLIAKIGLEKNDDYAQGLVYIDDQDITEARYYLTTFVSSVGEESAPSEPSLMLAVSQNDLVVVKQPPIPAFTHNEMGYDVAKWRVYRSNSGTTGTSFQFVKELAIDEAFSTAPYLGYGSLGTEHDLPGYGDKNKWRDVVATWVVYNDTNRGDNIPTQNQPPEPFTDCKELVIGDTVTLMDTTGFTYNTNLSPYLNGLKSSYAITKSWTGSRWVSTQVPDVRSWLASQADNKVFVDGVSGSSLGEVISTTTWLTPPARVDENGAVKGSDPYLRWLTPMPNGIMAGFIDNFVTFCEPYAPYAWPVEYQIPLDFPIVGLCAFGQTLVVGTVGNPYLVSGSDSMSMSAQKLDDNQACVSARSMVSAQGGVFYASPDGYCFASQNGVEVVTVGLFSHDDWQLLNPSSIFAVMHDSVLYFWYTGNGGGCYGLDLVAKKLTRHSISATAVYHDIEDDKPYVTYNGSILKLFSGASSTGVWKSGKITLPAQSGMAWIKVLSNFADGAVTVKWYGDGVLRHTATFSTIEPQRLPSGRWLEHEIEVSSKSRVTSIVLAGNTKELQDD